MSLFVRQKKAPASLERVLINCKWWMLHILLLREKELLDQG
ncbi:hypothetical protein HNO89_003448 [Sporosarcina luteola]|nr:hypothetical protein [Sporosarcina luteola]